MAAPLPEGSRLSILPQAPNIGDPRQYAMDAQGALLSQQLGLQIGQELANLENKKAQRTLEAEQIKLKMQQNKLDQLLADETARQLPLVAQKIIDSQLQDRMLRQYEQENLKAQAAAYGGVGLSFQPSGSMAPSTGSLSSSVATPATVAQEPADTTTPALSAAAIQPAIPGAASMNAGPLVQRKLAMQAAEKEVAIREQAAASEQAALHARIKPLHEAGAINLQGLYVPGTRLLDATKVNEAMAGLRKIPAYAPIFREIDKTAPAFTAQQGTLLGGLKPYIDSGLVAFADVADSEGSALDPKKASEKLKELTEKYPVQGKLVTSEQLMSLNRVKTAIGALEKAEGALDKLGDPTFFQAVLNFMPNPEEAKGTWKTARDVGAAKGLNPETVARNTLVQILNSQVQTALAGSGQSGGAGLAAKRMTPFEASYSNEQLKAAIKQAIPIAKEHYDDIIDSTGNPEVVRKYVERRVTPLTERNARAEIKIPEFVSRMTPEVKAVFESGGVFQGVDKATGQRYNYRRAPGGMLERLGPVR